MSYKSQIKSFEDACSYLGEDPKMLPIVDHLPADRQRQTLADYKLPIIAKAINTEANNDKVWVPDYANDDQLKYYPYFYWETDGSGFRFVATTGGWTSTGTDVGPRLSFLSSEAAEYFGRTFIDMHRDRFTMDDVRQTSVPKKPESLKETVEQVIGLLQELVK